MTKWLQWIILSSLTGNPILSLVILIVLWWTLDRFTLGILPDPFRLTHRFMRGGALRRTLGHNPNDRKARHELATLHVERRQYAQALPLLKANIEAGDEDANTLFLMAQACYGTGNVQQAERLLEEIDEREPRFRTGETHLERARWRLKSGDANGARQALQALLAVRPGSVEGKYLLASAHEKLGDDVNGAYARRDAWNDYAHAPRFQRRRDRKWAWRARPSRPLTYLAVAVVCGFLFSQYVGPVLQRAAEASVMPVYAYEPEE